MDCNEYNTAAMQALKAEFGDRFSTAFKTITADNGPEFKHLSVLENEGIGIYYAHPYCSLRQSAERKRKPPL